MGSEESEKVDEQARKMLLSSSLLAGAEPFCGLIDELSSPKGKSLSGVKRIYHTYGSRELLTKKLLRQ